MKVVQKDELPNCDICKQQGITKEASYDDKTTTGPWANMCEEHEKQYGVGVGYRLEKRVKIAAEKTNRVPTVVIPLTEDLVMDSLVDVQCPHCGESRSVETDANYVVTCENCENRYRVQSPI